MILLRKAYKLLNQLLSPRIWFASIIVVVLILLLALTVNHAREKEMVDLFSRQQLASAQNASARIAEILSQVERNIALFKYLDPNGKKLTQEDYRELDVVYSIWGRTIDAVLVFDADNNIRKILPQDATPGVDLTTHFSAMKLRKRQYLTIALSDNIASDSLAQTKDRYLIWGYPVWDQNNVFSGAWMISFSLAQLVDACERQIKDNKLGDLWLVNEQGRDIAASSFPVHWEIRRGSGEGSSRQYDRLSIGRRQTHRCQNSPGEQQTVKKCYLLFPVADCRNHLVCHGDGALQ